MSPTLTNREDSDLSLAPRRTRSLALWDPRDYLLLLYWVFFFPQAIRWYVDKFADARHHDSKGRELLAALRSDKIRRQLVLQAIFVTILTVIGGTSLLAETGVEVNMLTALGGVTGGITGGMVYGFSGGIVTGVATGIALGIGGGIAAGIAGGVVSGIAAGVALGIAGGIGRDIVAGVVGGIAFGVVRGTAVGVVGGIGASILRGFPFGAAFSISITLTVLRLLEWSLARVTTPRRRQKLWSRMVWLPLPFVERHLEDTLSKSWTEGVYEATQYLSYSMQFIAVVRATNTTFSRSSQAEIISRATILSDQPYDWSLVRFCSADLGNTIHREFIDGLPLIPGKLRNKWKARYPNDLRLNRPYRCACAGFWLWHNEDTLAATDAFARVRELPHGEEIYQISRALVDERAVISKESLTIFCDGLQWLDSLPDPELRPGTLQFLRQLRKIEQEIEQAGDILQELVDNGHQICPEPEWSQFRKVAKRWQGIFAQEP